MSNILHRLRPKKNINKMSIFEKFWSGNHRALVENVRNDPSLMENPDNIHYIFASLAILDESLEEVAKK